MRYFILTLLTVYIVSVTAIGLPLEMKISGLSRSGDELSFLTTHESIVKIIARSEMRVSCSNNQNVCVRPIDYSHLKPNMPVAFERCQSHAKVPVCDDLALVTHFNSRDLIKIGLRL